MEIDNVIILGRAVPEQTKDGRITVCAAGWCEQHGFIRLYPTRVDSPLKLWSVISVDVERNPRDSRGESWKLLDSRHGWEKINNHISVKGEVNQKKRLKLLESIKSNCVNCINQKKSSLGIIRPIIKHWYLATNSMHFKAYQPLFSMMEHSSIRTKRNYFAEPRLRYLCGNSCSVKQFHDMQLLDWGCYEWMKKNPQQPEGIWRNMGIGSEDEWTHYFLVGNQENQRTSYMVINVLRQKNQEIQPSLFSV
jgi:hypothetical protein